MSSYRVSFVKSIEFSPIAKTIKNKDQYVPINEVARNIFEQFEETEFLERTEQFQVFEYSVSCFHISGLGLQERLHFCIVSTIRVIRETENRTPSGLEQPIDFNPTVASCSSNISQQTILSVAFTRLPNKYYREISVKSTILR